MKALTSNQESQLDKVKFNGRRSANAWTAREINILLRVIEEYTGTGNRVMWNRFIANEPETYAVLVTKAGRVKSCLWHKTRQLRQAGAVAKLQPAHPRGYHSKKKKRKYTKRKVTVSGIEAKAAVAEMTKLMEATPAPTPPVMKFPHACPWCSNDLSSIVEVMNR